MSSATSPTQTFAEPLPKRGSDEHEINPDSSPSPKATCAPSIEIGTSIGHYLVLNILGRGGMGTVFEVFDRTLDRRVALKLLNHNLASTHAQRLIREAKALAQLSHPNVVQVYEVGKFGNQTYIAMELVRGNTLRKWQKQLSAPDWRACVRLYCQAGAGLAAAHHRDLIHRDFKPSNVVVDDSGRVRVLDFGLARISADRSSVSGRRKTSDTSQTDPRDPAGTNAYPPSSSELDIPLTEVGTVVGTPAYMPPEQIQGQFVDARSDQFSFCVALFEAVYGERPFAGVDVEQIQANQTAGRIAAAPHDSKVPVALRKILIRGLALKPENRWQSMEAVLHQLEQLVSPPSHRRSLLLITAVGALGLGGVISAYQVKHVADQQRCSGAAAQLNGIWDGPSRDRMADAFLKTGQSHALTTWEKVDRQLSEYATEWSTKYTEVCEATVRHEQSEADMSLRMSCLHERKLALHSLTNIFIKADQEVMNKAVSAAITLPQLSTCDDTERLRKQLNAVPLPEDPKIAMEVESLREQLTEIRTEVSVGKAAQALAKAELILSRARILDYPPLIAMAVNARGLIRVNLDQNDVAELDLLEAQALAIEHRLEELEFYILNQLAYVVGVHQARYAEGLQWSRRLLPVARRNKDPHSVIASISTRGVVLYHQGNLEEAEAHLRQAQQIHGSTPGSNPLTLAKILNNLGNVLERQGKHEEAASFAQQSIKILEELLGPDHPTVGKAIDNLGISLAGQGKYREAEAQHRLAIERLGRVFGTEHSVVASSIGNLAATLAEQERYEEAIPQFQKAVHRLKSAVGPNHEAVLLTTINLGDTLIRAEEYEEAARILLEVMKLAEETLGPDHILTAYALLCIAAINLEQNDPHTALQQIKRVIAGYEKTPVAPEVVARAHFIQAKALWPDHTQRLRARTSAEHARMIYTQVGQGQVRQLARVEQWLDTHRIE